MKVHLLFLRECSLRSLVVAGRQFDHGLFRSRCLLVCIFRPRLALGLWPTFLLFRPGARSGRIRLVGLLLLYLLTVRNVSWIGHSRIYTRFVLFAPPTLRRLISDL